MFPVQFHLLIIGFVATGSYIAAAVKPTPLAIAVQEGLKLAHKLRLDKFYGKPVKFLSIDRILVLQHEAAAMAIRCD
ncbi:conserved hypothetical protein [Ricinus communis]|uniref:Uncharacterized protein n=1 Tax=Ricinus communis TaxID=3988 RepID=B9RS67_RICCO|nr:conserved hypothetical protein [Ricinus communis]